MILHFLLIIWLTITQKTLHFQLKKMNYVEISYSKGRPKKLENNAFVLYTPQRIKLQPGEIKIVEVIKKSCRKLCITTFTYIAKHQTFKRLSYFNKQFNVTRFTVQSCIWNSKQKHGRNNSTKSKNWAWFFYHTK